MLGRIHSIQTLGTVDGPGVRFLVFMQGCPLRCGFCHNPDTWDMAGGREISAEELCQKALRYRAYFGSEGGITVSGGEPLLQADFVHELFTLCKKAGLHTALDTSGCIWNTEVEKLLSVTDLVLLDHKMPDDKRYRAHVGCGINAPLRFLDELNARGIDTWLRRVIVTGVNDTVEDNRALFALQHTHQCVKKIELLPFHKICYTKYEQMGIPFPFGDKPATSKAQIEAILQALE
ncbi:MAG: pyruvate formate lyase-activating protein [Clostridia bacterium]|nr:pyruvate formate lyase-activating protein [Clostridia bacterium]